jgi:hypothetical protein
MLWNITREYMENKSRCWGILLENTLNINYGMENKFKCWKTLLYNILNGEYC